MSAYRQVAEHVAGECPQCGTHGRMIAFRLMPTNPRAATLDTGESCAACGWFLDYDALPAGAYVPTKVAAVMVRAVAEHAADIRARSN